MVTSWASICHWAEITLKSSDQDSRRISGLAAKMASWHHFICLLDRFVHQTVGFTVGCFPLFSLWLLQRHLYALILFVHLHCVCVWFTHFNIQCFHKVCVCLSLFVSLTVSNIGRQSTTSSFCCQASYSFTCCISGFYFPCGSLGFISTWQTPECQCNALHHKTEHALPTLSLHQWSMWI